MIRRFLPFVLLGLVACAGILGLRTNKVPRRFEHRAHVLEGISCLDCHLGIESAGLEGPLHLPETKSCMVENCHPKPHDKNRCANCHGLPYTVQDLLHSRAYLRFEHRRHFNEATRGNCVRCHTDVKTAGARLRPKMAACLGCHRHQDMMSLRDCEGCHVDLPAELVKPESHLVHDGDFMREHGVRAAATSDICATCHRTSFCTQCHGATVPGLPARLAFDDNTRPSVHKFGFRARHSGEAKANSGLCITCHSQDFCSGCHQSAGVAAGTATPGSSPHPLGWVGDVSSPNTHGRAARMDPVGCAACHSGAGESMCIGCHQEGGVGGSPHPIGWTSSRSKAELPCSRCHISPN